MYCFTTSTVSLSFGQVICILIVLKWSQRVERNGKKITQKKYRDNSVPTQSVKNRSHAQKKSQLILALSPIIMNYEEMLVTWGKKILNW